MEFEFPYTAEKGRDYEKWKFNVISYAIGRWLALQCPGDEYNLSINCVTNCLLPFTGVSIRFCSFEGANENVWHVLVSKA